MRAGAQLRDDAASALRGLRRRPGFTVAALATLTLGLGASAALLGLVDSVLLRPLPYPDADRIHAVWFASPTLPGGLDRVRHSEGTYVHFRDRSEVYAAFALAQSFSVTVDDGVRATRVPAARVTPDLHEVLGREVAVGRSLQPRDMAPDGEPVILLSDALWAERYGRAPDALGQMLTVDGVDRRIVGVLPKDLRFPSAEVRMWVPMSIDEARPDALNFLYTGYGRLAPGKDRVAAEADFLRLVDLLPDVMPEFFPRPLLERAQFSPRIETLPEVVLGDSGPVFALLGVAVLVLLAIAGTNVASLTVVRTEGRVLDLAVRAASGATTRRIQRLLLIEGVALAWAGAVLGALVAGPALQTFARGGEGLLPRLSEVGLTGRALAFTFVAASVLGLGAGALPALRVRGERLTGQLRSGVRSVGAGRSAARIRKVLVAAQVALAVVLVMNAGLLVRSFQRVLSVDTGFDSEGVLTARLALDGRGYRDLDEAWAFLLPFIDHVSTLPGVTAAALSNHLPLREGRIFRPFVVQDVPETAELPNPRLTRIVTDRYFETLGVSVAAGRTFDRDDVLADRPVAIVSRSLAEAWWPGQSALGKQVSYGGDEGGDGPEWLEIVGVAENVRDRDIDAEPAAMVYVPFQRRHLGNERWRELSLALRGVDPAGAVPALRRALADRDRSVPLYDVRTMSEVVRDVTRRDRTVMALLVASALVALALAAVGLYGVLSYVVNERRREIGLRLALGAEPFQVRRLVVRQAGTLVGLGLLGGLVALAYTRGIVEQSLYGVEGTDPATLVAVLVILAGVSALATYGPAGRASSLSPTITLRAE